MKASLAFVLALVLLVLPASGSAFEKIASAGGDITEILFEIGVGDRVVAVDNTSIYPDSVRDLKQIGYVRDLSAEGVLSTGADILIGAHDMGSPAVMDNLAAAGMTVAFAPEGAGVSRYEEKVRFIGEQLGLEEQADAMIKAYYAAVESVRERAAALDRSPRVLLILSMRDGIPIVAGGQTSGHDIIEAAGGTNVVEFAGWKPMNSEVIIEAQPEIIILTDIHGQRPGDEEAILARPDIAITPAGKNRSVVLLNAQMVLQFGPRSPIAMQRLVGAFEALPERY